LNGLKMKTLFSPENKADMDIVEIYTDGGCSPNPGPGAWAAVLISEQHGKTKEISGAEPDTTNNRMELLAAIESLRTLKKPCRVKLHTDSQYLQKAFGDGWLENWVAKGWKTAGKKPVANKDLWQELLKLTDIHNVDFVWVKGHAGNEYNERCDELVGLARQTMMK